MRAESTVMPRHVPEAFHPPESVSSISSEMPVLLGKSNVDDLVEYDVFAIAILDQGCSATVFKSLEQQRLNEFSHHGRTCVIARRGIGTIDLVNDTNDIPP
jgi:hypothetical protein